MLIHPVEEGIDTFAEDRHVGYSFWQILKRCEDVGDGVDRLKVGYEMGHKIEDRLAGFSLDSESGRLLCLPFADCLPRL